MPSICLNTTAALLAVLPLALAPLPALGQQRSQSARDLVRDVMYNELHDNDTLWEYRSECISGDKHVLREQVETKQGPIFRVLQRDGAPLNAAEQRKEDERLADYIHDPGQIAHVRREHQEDEQRLDTIIAMVPQAFLFEYQTSGEAAPDTVRIAFRPDPAFVPSGYEARIVHALTGTLTVNTRLKRMIDMRGVLQEKVDFGYGLLGHVEKGGSFEIHRRQVSAEHWKTDVVDVRIHGKLLGFRTIGKVERETRTAFRPVPGGMSLAAAEAMLTGAGSETQTAEAQLAPAE